MTMESLAVCSVQYMSCLLYDDEENPVFAPWTPAGGGGPPSLWEVDGDIYDQSTHSANIEFLKTTLSVAYVQYGLTHAAERITDSGNSKVVAQMLDEFEFQRIVLEERLEKLPRA